MWNLILLELCSKLLHELLLVVVAILDEYNIRIWEKLYKTLAHLWQNELLYTVGNVHHWVVHGLYYAIRLHKAREALRDGDGAAALAILYMLAIGKRRPLRQVLPGVILSLLAWMLVSAGFSYYVEHIAGYTLLYGSVAAVVVTLLWLYMSGLVLIMGAEFNAMLYRGRYGDGERKRGP